MQMQVQMHPPRRNQVQVQMQMPHLHLHLQMQVHLSTSLVQASSVNMFKNKIDKYLVKKKKKKKKKKKLYSTPNRQMYKLQYLTYQIYNLSNYVRTYIDIMCINIHRRYKKIININNVLWGR